MKKATLLFIVIVTSLSYVTGNNNKANTQKHTIYCGIAFYNLENLFDTIHDAGKHDEEFLPNGSYHWNTLKYTHKQANMSKVLSELCTERLKVGAAFIGLSEIENSRVLDDLINQPALKARGYKYLHIEGPDARGVDCAALYNPQLFKPTGCKLIPPTGYYEATGYGTRGFLLIEGNMLGERMHFIVNHWPSRRANSYSREFVGRLVRKIVDSIQVKEPDAKIIIMGDLNDEPDNKSVANALGAKLSEKKITSKQDLYNPWGITLRKNGEGTLLYDNMWNLFDQIIFTANFLGSNRSDFKFFKNEIYKPEYITTKYGRYKGSPKRTTGGGVWQDGYSDHFPTQIYLVKEIIR